MEDAKEDYFTSIPQPAQLMMQMVLWESQWSSLYQVSRDCIMNVMEDLQESTLERCRWESKESIQLI
jgi:hypothetical protein